MFLPGCDSLSCGCLPPRVTAFLVPIISLAGCLADDMILKRYPQPACCPLAEKVKSLRRLIVSLFQIANLFLLVASILKNSCLVQLYLWYTLGFVVMGLLVALMEFLLRSKEAGPFKSLVLLIPEVLFLFVICQCLPLVDKYREQLTMHNVAADLKASQYQTLPGPAQESRWK